MVPTRRRLPAPTVYLLLSGASAFFFTLVFTISAVYRVTAAGLDPLQLVLVGTVLEVAYFLFEIPTGVVADVYSRRLSIIIGLTLIGLGFLIEGAVPLFATILLAQVVWGIGATFTSGAEEAWLADEVGEARAGPLYLRGAQVGQVCALVGALVSAGLASLWLNLPILLGGALFLVLAGLLALVMPEAGFHATPRGARTTWQTLSATFLAGVRVVRGRPALATILALAAFYGMFSEGFDRLWEAHLLANFRFPAIGAVQPVVWFGIISAGSMLLSLGVTEIARRRLDTTSHRAVAWSLLGINGLLMAMVIAFGLAGDFVLALTTYWAAAVLRHVNQPLYAAWINQHVDPHVRATVISMSGQVDSFGQIAGGPLLGLVGSALSLRAAMLAAAAALLPALLLYLRALGQRHHGER